MIDVDVVVVGAGPAGIFAAITAASLRADLRIVVLEAGSEALRKVRISGGGRCNVTNACWDLRDLAARYPRGQRELLGPFHRFGPVEMLDWLDQHGVATKEEDNGRMFPSSDDSMSIVGVLLKNAERLGVEVRLRTAVRSLEQNDDEWVVASDAETWRAAQVVLATGSSKAGWRLAESLQIALQPAVPSLFTFKIPTKSLHRYSGVSMPRSRVSVMTRSGDTFTSEGALLVTHWGLSGPAVLWCSALAARALAAVGYTAEVQVQWDSHIGSDQVTDWIDNRRRQAGKKMLRNDPPQHLPKRLWQWALGRAECAEDMTWAMLSAATQQRLVDAAAAPILQMAGQSVYKEEFVTAGGIELKEIDFRTMAVKNHSGLFAVGEMLDIDAMTGGYNFQACWTGGFLAGQALAEQS